MEAGIDWSQNIPFDVRPKGTKIYYREARDPDAAWILAGTSPLAGITLPRGQLRFPLRKGGVSDT